ncbi:MAG: hypothetical protein KatS3mg019_2407 [Fimbriimonadales bacterium]|nr:MAG: hypothetical protein KatS3mg019_2407 [Fimbriimonadales bacterium]
MRTTLCWIWVLLIASVAAQPKLLLILVHEPLTPQELTGEAHAQAAWMVWERSEGEPFTFATGRAWNTKMPKLQLELISPAHTAETNHRVALKAGTQIPESLAAATLGVRLRRVGRSAIYLSTPQSQQPSPYALIALSEQRRIPARVYPDLDALRFDFFALQADWAILELKRWDYRALELLLAEGVEVWAVSLPSPEGLSSGQTRLSAVVRYAAREPRGLLTSPRTRWNGVIRERDLAPTIYRALTGKVSDSFEGAPAFETRQSDWHRFWNGWLVRLAIRETAATVGTDWKGSALQRHAEWLQAQQEVLPMLRSSLLILLVVWLSAGVALWRTHCLRGLSKSVFIAGLSVFCLTPAVAVCYSYYPYQLRTGDLVRDTASLASWLTLWWMILSLLAAGVARWGQTSLLSAFMMVGLAGIGTDLLIAGGYGVNRSILSGGIASDKPFGANEWFWAYALSAGVLVPASWLESRGRVSLGARGQTALGMAFGLMLCLFGLPMLGGALDALLPMTLAFGLGIGLYTGLLRPQMMVRYTKWLCAGLAGLGIALTLGAIGLDSVQPWQRQAGWVSGWWAALGWKFAPLQAILIASATATIAFVLREPLGRLWQRAYILSHALTVGLITAGLALALGKVVAASVILLMCLLFMLEYLIGGKDWGYVYSGNGVAH